MTENGKINNFTDLNAWEKAHELVIFVYELTRAFPKEEIYGVTSQLRRAAASVTANIAEGFSRYHYKEKNNFYYIARGSLGETENFVYIAKDLKYLSEPEFKKALGLCEETKKILNGLIRSAKKMDS